MKQISQILLVAVVLALAAGCEEPVPTEVIRPVRAIKIGDAGIISGRSVQVKAQSG